MVWLTISPFIRLSKWMDLICEDVTLFAMRVFVPLKRGGIEVFVLAAQIAETWNGHSFVLCRYYVYQCLIECLFHWEDAYK